MNLKDRYLDSEDRIYFGYYSLFTHCKYFPPLGVCSWNPSTPLSNQTGTQNALVEKGYKTPSEEADQINPPLCKKKIVSFSTHHVRELFIDLNGQKVLRRCVE